MYLLQKFAIMDVIIFLGKKAVALFDRKLTGENFS
jgi:hypothetical protein